jgi:hypothetical protein
VSDPLLGRYRVGCLRIRRWCRRWAGLAEASAAIASLRAELEAPYVPGHIPWTP